MLVTAASVADAVADAASAVVADAADAADAAVDAAADAAAADGALIHVPHVASVDLTNVAVASVDLTNVAVASVAASVAASDLHIISLTKALTKDVSNQHDLAASVAASTVIQAMDKVEHSHTIT